MSGKAVRHTVDLRQAMVDLVELVAKAILSGVGIAVLMSVAILALSTETHAAVVGLEDAKSGELLFGTDESGRFVMAPKVSTEVAIEVHGMVARTRLTQVFHNPAAEFVEGIYVFPLPEKAAVDRLWMKIGERTIEGHVQEKEKARATYEQAKGEGRKAALVVQQRPNLFTNAVAHIGPDERIEIRIEYQQSLAYEDGRYRLRLPMAVSPRYVPVVDPNALPDEPKALEARAELQPAVLRMPPQSSSRGTLVNPIDIAVMLDAGVPIIDVASTYHETRVEKQSGARAVVLLAKDQVEMDRDFELTWRVAGTAPQAAMFVQRKGDTDYALLMVVPPRPQAAESGDHQRLPRETILIVDTSGSMQGSPMDQAKLALEHALRTLRPTDRFNVLEFNSITRALYTDAMPATATNIAEARAWVQKLQAGGGTNMAPALTLALPGGDTPGYLRQVVFMTDGAVGNEDELFRLITQRLGGSRLFTVGIGAAPNGHFMAKAAQFGRGSFTHIGDLREVQEKMVELFAKIEAPVLRDVTIRWADGTAVETFPARVPDLYLGEPVLVAASTRKALSTVVVSGMRGNQPWSVALTPAADANAAGVGALWAREKIASLMDEATRGA
ncbi:MAG TPA: marine proteobacterial sortase target protein, partial [Usitatibacter sp.]|nr:marine proteobacterial sortase target protein [Usitatibacter sp.]